MNILGNFLNFTGVITLFLGVIILIYPISALGFSKRSEGLVTAIGALLMVTIGQYLSGPSPSGSERVAMANAAPKPIEKPLSHSEMIAKIRLDGFRWNKDSFGSIMKATFVIYNDNKSEIKDVVVTCSHKSNSGTKIDSNTRTIYERIPPGGYQSVVDFNMGFIHSAVQSTQCAIAGFSKV